jgi:hypothetical protein
MPQVTSEQVGPCCRRLTVEVPKAVVRECFEKTVEDMRNITGNLAGMHMHMHMQQICKFYTAALASRCQEQDLGHTVLYIEHYDCGCHTCCLQCPCSGFRRDKIPLSMLITQCGGQAKFKIACIEEVLLKGMELVMSQIKDPVVPGSERVGAG